MGVLAVSDSRLRQLERAGRSDPEARSALRLEAARAGNLEPLRADLEALVAPWSAMLAEDETAFDGTNAPMRGYRQSDAFALIGGFALKDVPGQRVAMGWCVSGVHDRVFRLAVLHEGRVTYGAALASCQRWRRTVGRNPGRAWPELRPWTVIRGSRRALGQGDGSGHGMPVTMAFARLHCAESLAARLREWAASEDEDRIRVPDEVAAALDAERRARRRG